MALFAYQGTNVRGETFSGSLRANSSVEARQKLRQKHIKVSSLIEQPANHGQPTKQFAFCGSCE